MADHERDLQDLKEAVRARSDIVEIVGQYTRLQKAGKNWKGLCPFHADKRPSFDVSPTLQIYKCWSCGEGGDVFKFIQKKENLEFMGALEWLARRAGIPFEWKGVDREQASRREQMFELNGLAVRFFQDRLAKSEQAREYLAKRGILKSTQDQFELGFAPEQWEALAFYLERKRVNLALAVETGLIKARPESGSHYDVFRNRLIFPIHDVNGRVIAFGGRAMDANPAKYLNSEQSPLFDKSHTLYGLNFARRKLSGETPAVFVEGYMDVVTTHQAGFAQCVATLGTSMTADHARILARYNPHIIICYDGDAAGIKATLRGAGVWESMGIEGAEVRVARLPDGEDPDSLLLKGDTAGFQAALDKAVPRVDFQIEIALKKHDLETEDGRDSALAEVIPIIASVASQTQRDRYAQKVARLHPSSRYNISRAIAQIVADAETYALNSRAPIGRDRGYPLTEASNGGALREQPPPPVYRPGGANRWPMTQHIVIRKGETGGQDSRSAGGGGKYRDRNGGRTGPQSDPTPPSLAPPSLTHSEKAERQLLRALFNPEWRTRLLGQLNSEALVTPQGRRLFERIARTEADADGGIDPMNMLHQVEAEETAAASEKSTRDFRREAGDPASADEIHNTLSRENIVTLSSFIRELWEDSESLLSNEPLNEAAVNGYVRRLERNRQDRAIREQAELLQRAEDLPPEERRAYIEAYHLKMRAVRGSPLDEEET